MRRLKIMASEREQPFTLGKVGSQQVLVAFDGGRLVSDAGLTGVRRIWFHLSETWPPRDLGGRVLAAVPAFVRQMPAGSSGATAEPRGDGSREKRPGAARVRRRRPGPSKGYRAAAQAATTTPGRGCVAKDRYNSVLRGSPLHLLRHGARCGLVIHRSSYDRWAGHSCPAWLRDKS